MINTGVFPPSQVGTLKRTLWGDSDGLIDNFVALYTQDLFKSIGAFNCPTGYGVASIQYLNNQFVYLKGQLNGDYTTGGAAIVTSPDGVTWTNRATMATSYSPNHIVYGANIYVAIHGRKNAPGSFIAYNTGYRSTDNCVSFTTFTLPSSELWQSVAHGSDKFVVLSTTDKSAYSQYGSGTWTANTLPVSADYRIHKYTGNVFIAVGYDSNISLISSNGIDWNQVLLPVSGQWTLCTYHGTTIILGGVSRGFTRFVKSVDNGATWELLDLTINTATGLLYAPTTGVYVIPQTISESTYINITKDFTKYSLKRGVGPSDSVSPDRTVTRLVVDASGGIFGFSGDSVTNSSSYPINSFQANLDAEEVGYAL